MKLKGKKALLFSFGLAITLLIVLLRAYSLMSANKAFLSAESSIGSNQLKIFSAIQEADKAVIYGDQALSNVMQQYAYDIASRGGFIVSGNCGGHLGYNFWSTGSSSCYPEIPKIKTEFEIAIPGLFSPYTGFNPYTPRARSYEIAFQFSKNSTTARAYSLSTDFNRIYCIYGEPPTFGQHFWGFETQVKGTCGTYFSKPSYMKKVEVGIGHFKEAIQYAKEIESNVNKCRESNPVDLCMSSELQKVNKKSTMKWGLCRQLFGVNIFFICADTGAKVIAQEGSSNLGIKNAEIKFAMAFPESTLEMEIGPEQSAEIEFEEGDAYSIDSSLNIDTPTYNRWYRYINGEWEWKCHNCVFTSSSYQKTDASSVSDLPEQYKKITELLSEVRNSYYKGIEIIQEELNKDNNAFLIIHYTSGCTHTTIKENEIEDLAETAFPSSTAPYGTPCDSN